MTKLGRLEKRVMLSDRHAEDNLRNARMMLEHVDMEGKREYLELGCGGGQVVRFISSEYGLSCTGTDLDPEMVSHAEAHSEGMQKVCFMVAAMYLILKSLKHSIAPRSCFFSCSLVLSRLSVLMRSTLIFSCQSEIPYP